jgi:ABC-2 type transport system permease protein
VTRAPLTQMLLAQTAMETRLTLRRGESVLVTLVIPLALLVFLTALPLGVDAIRLGEHSRTTGGAVHLLLPGVLALAVMSTSLVSLGIATAYERYYGVLKRLGGSPLPRSVLIGAKLLSVCFVELLQAVLLIGAGIVLGWRPAPGATLATVPLAIVGVLLGTAAFGGLGLWMAGSWRAEATLAGANGVYLALLLFGGILIPATALPQPLGTLAGFLPSAALADVLRHAFSTLDAPPERFVVLVAWAILAPLLAALTFKWE